MKIKKSLFAVLLILQGYVNAQILISGNVVDPLNTAIEFANVMLTDANGKLMAATITDENGKFQFDFNVRCDCKLTISYLGYKTWHANLKDLKNMELGVIQLLETETMLDEVNLVSRKKVIAKEGNKIVFFVENNKEISGLDGLEVLKFAPRVNPTTECPEVFGKQTTLIYINGRPTNQLPNGDCRYLTAIRSENIKKIEIITSTTAQYEAEGNKAIINIVLKNKLNNGFDGSSSMQYRQRTFPAFMPSTSLTYSNEKLSASFFTMYFKDKQKNLLNSNFYFDETTRFSETKTDPNFDGFLANFNLDYQINSKVNIGTAFNSNFSKNDSESTTETINGNRVTQATDSIFALPTKGVNDDDYYAISLYSDFKLDTLGSKLKLSANTLRRKQESERMLESTLFSEDNTEIRTEQALNISDYDYQVNSLNTDIEITKAKTKWGIGGKVTLIENDSDISFFNIEDSVSVLDPSQSNKFLYNENIYATYLIIDLNHWEKWFLQIGLRFEYTETKGESVTLNETNRDDYSDFFPSVYMSFDPNDNHSFSFAYTTSLNRPQFQDVNPFRIFTSLFSFSEGNPQLLPSYTNNIELSYIFKSNLSFFLTNTFTNDSSDYLTFTENTGNIDITTPLNYFDQYIFSMDMRYKWEPTKWYSNQLSLNWSYSESTSELPNVTLPKLTGSGITFSTNSVFMLNQTNEDKFYLRFFQTTPSTDAFLKIQSSANLTLGGVFNFLKKRLVLQFQATDVFRQRKIIALEKFQKFKLQTETYNDNQGFAFTLTYKFGNKKSKNRERNVDQSERNRMN